MLTIFLEGVDGHDCKFGVIFGVGGQVEIDHFFHHFIIGEGSSAHLGENGWCIHPQSHVADNLPHYISTLFAILLVDNLIEQTT